MFSALMPVPALVVTCVQEAVHKLLVLWHFHVASSVNRLRSSPLVSKWCWSFLPENLETDEVSAVLLVVATLWGKQRDSVTWKHPGGNVEKLSVSTFSCCWFAKDLVSNDSAKVITCSCPTMYNRGNETISRWVAIVPMLLCKEQIPKKFFCVGSCPVWLSITNYRACQWRCFKKSRVMLHLEESHGQDDSRVFSNTSLCVPGSVGSDHCGEPAGDFCSVQRCVCALEVWQIRPGECPCVHKHTHAYTHTALFHLKAQNCGSSIVSFWSCSCHLPPLLQLVWVASLISTLIFNLDLGLAVAVIFSLCTLLYRTKQSVNIMCECRGFLYSADILSVSSDITQILTYSLYSSTCQQH